jgi:DNA-binding GntR family transcriptional regulator
VGARNRRLTALYQTLQTTLIVARAIYPSIYRGDTRREGEHRKILTALQAHDAQLAREAIVEHLVRSRDATLRHTHGRDQRSNA